MTSTPLAATSSTILEGDAAVDLDPRREPEAVDPRAQAARLVEHRGDERLAAEAGVHRHQEDEIRGGQDLRSAFPRASPG